MSVSRQNERECWRCGAGNFTLDHIKFCKVENAMCNYCGRKGHLERVCNKKKNDTSQKNGKLRTPGKNEQSGRRVQLVDQDDEEDDTDYAVLKIDGDDENNKPYFMEGFINGNRFKAIIDSASPVTFFALDELKKVLKRENLQVRNMIKGGKYVDFNGKLLNPLRYVFCDSRREKATLKKREY